MDYIFTDLTRDVIFIYLDFQFSVDCVMLKVLNYISQTVPTITKNLIGYCHFYYQLGYGLIFYIYIYRRYRAKKTKNWRSFYGNSISNWAFFNLSVFNKFMFNRNFIIYLKIKIFKSTKLLLLSLATTGQTSEIFYKFKSILQFYSRYIILHAWTPLFKRSSYIYFVSFVKRFIKKK